MDRLSHQVVYKLLKVFDIIAAGLCLFAAAAYANMTNELSGIAELMSLRISVHNVCIVLGLLTVWHFILRKIGFYSSRRLYTIPKEIFVIFKGATAVAMVILAIQFIYPMQIVNMKVLQFFWLFCVAVFTVSRLTLRVILHLLRKKGRNIKKILFIGSNERALQCAQKFSTNTSYGYKIVGFVDKVWHGPTLDEQSWCKLVANFETFSQFLKDNVVDEIYIFLPLKSYYGHIASVISASEDQGVIVRMGLDFFNLRVAQGRIEQVQEETVLTLYTGAMRRRAIVFKEILDRSIATVLLLMLLPLFLIVGIVIKYTSPGPIFFKQKRIGFNKRPFFIYKFRTMISDAEAKLKDIEHLNQMGPDSAAFKLKNDPRITPLGGILRKFSIDELPQLINVLLGEMSIVGPRPLTERDYNSFKILQQIRRFSVKPGITCLWQVGGRNNISFDRWMELDMQYIDEWSLLLDAKILLKTIPAVFGGNGAY